MTELTDAPDLDAATEESKYAPVVKLVYTMDLGSISETSRGSNPLGCTNVNESRNIERLNRTVQYFYPHFIGEHFNVGLFCVDSFDKIK